MGPFLGIILLGIAIMLGIMGFRQFRMGYRIAGATSVVIAITLFALVIWLLGAEVTAG